MKGKLLKERTSADFMLDASTTKLGLQQISDSFGYSLEFWNSNSKINIWYSFTYLL